MTAAEITNNFKIHRAAVLSGEQIAGEIGWGEERLCRHGSFPVQMFLISGIAVSCKLKFMKYICHPNNKQKGIMEKLKATSVWIVFLFLCVAGIRAQSVTPSKKYVTKEVKDISNFNAVSVLGSTDVEYRQSGSSGNCSVSVYGSDNLVDLTEITVADGVLQVKMKSGVRIKGGERRLKVMASSPALNRVEIKGSADVSLKGSLKGTDLLLNVRGSGDIDADCLEYEELSAQIKGSGDISLKNVKAADVDVKVKGSGDVSIKGSARNAVLTVSGSGDIEAEKLVAAKVTATVAGSGDISCYASERLDAKAGDSGDIEYKGNPPVVNKSGREKQISGK